MMYGCTDNQLWRKERLMKAKRLASAILGMSEKQLERLVFGMYDSKGHLVVFWDNVDATAQQKLAFATAWDMCGENSSSVTHEHDSDAIERWV